MATAKSLTKDKSPRDYVVQDKHGNALSKQETVNLLKAYGVHVGCSPDRISGHARGVTGAQRMAAAGLSAAQIKAFGRWGSTTQMIKYAREALIGPNLIAGAMRQAPSIEASARVAKRPCTGKRWSKLRSCRNASGDL